MRKYEVIEDNGGGLTLVVFNNNGIEMYKDDQNVYWKGYETNYQVEYLQDVANASDSIYVYYYPKKKNGSVSKQKSIKRNRINQPFHNKTFLQN